MFVLFDCGTVNNTSDVLLGSTVDRSRTLSGHCWDGCFYKRSAQHEFGGPVENILTFTQMFWLNLKSCFIGTNRFNRNRFWLIWLKCLNFQLILNARSCFQLVGLVQFFHVLFLVFT